MFWLAITHNYDFFLKKNIILFKPHIKITFLFKMQINQYLKYADNTYKAWAYHKTMTITIEGFLS